MTMVTVDEARTVPVQEDLTTEELSFAVLRGFENMHRVDKKLSSGVSLLTGEWAVLSSGELVRPSTTPVAATYPVLSGTDRFDVKATGKATLIMNSNVVVKSNKFNASGSYAEGTLLTVKDLGSGEAVVTPASNGEFVLAKVQEVGQGYLVFEVFPGGFKKS